MALNSLDEIIRYAIRKEADSATFYEFAAEHSHPGAKKILLELAEMEKGHRKKLENFDLEKIDQMKIKPNKGLGLSEIMEDILFSSDLNYADLLRMAIKNEEKSERFYLSAEKMTVEPSLRKLLRMLAREESGHKEKLEKIYDEEVLAEF